MRSKNRLIFAVLIGASPINAIASEIGDTEDIAALRSQYIQAVESNNPDAVGGLVTDDFVMLQPNKKGPDTYGRAANVNYRQSLSPVSALTVEPYAVIQCGADTVIEAGIEMMTVSTPQVEIPVTTRYVKVLSRDAGRWRYARAMMAISEYSDQAPPTPGKITNYGYATWEPRSQSGALGAEADSIRAVIAKTKLLADTEGTGFSKHDTMAIPDDATGPMIGMGTQGEIRSFEQYKQMDAAAREIFQLDDLRKIVEELYVCDADTAYAFGQDAYSGVNLITGEREVQSSDFWYMFSKQNGEWKLGPMAITWEEM